MADRLTIARPYARAAFAEARGHQRLEPWSEALRVAAEVVRDPRVRRLLGNPRVTPEQLAQLVSGIAGTQLGREGANLVRMLAANRRLGYLPEISALFDELKDAALGVADVTVTSAAPVDASQQRKLAAALQNRLKRTIRLHCAIDPQLIGGAVLRTGDLVIDGSLRTRLDRIAYELTA
ncbi:MAG: F0F1 ATP synthase subunit delta [Gammaproteobacteria bacterium]|nr:MAG: F0F1 ATP synthase subunit delta [Gammaproteobacteria bacterium]TLZ51419.1 MAG: F0F1 ATP synthase subunit delta [Gammaproteobacteria bacterium]TLZ59591.1 MAG: F0F1 ATP synthase subunit delta [Gammaproteobacteria bacterium]